MNKKLFLFFICLSFVDKIKSKTSFLSSSSKKRFRTYDVAIDDLQSSALIT